MVLVLYLSSFVILLSFNLTDLLYLEEEETTSRMTQMESR